MSSPLVTVILPAKDAAAHLEATLTTLLRQFDDRDALKLVAVDDGSRDDTRWIMRRFAQQLSHAEVIGNASPLGLASARNLGLPFVEGDFFCFLDGDDWMQPLRLQSLVRSMRDLECDFVRTDHVTDLGGRRALRRAPFEWRDIVMSPREGILPVDETTMVDYPYAWAGMFHRRVIDEGLAHFPDGLFTTEDRPWIWRLHLQASSFAVVDAPAILYRRGVTTSLTPVHDRQQLDFIPSFAQTIDLVTADADAELFLPKVTTAVLTVSAHHLRRARGMTWRIREDLRRGVRELVARLPDDAVDIAVERLSDTERRLLAPSIRAVRQP